MYNFLASTRIAGGFLFRFAQLSKDTNESEVVADIAAMRDDIDLRTALRLNPYIQEEEIEGLVAAQ